MRRAIRIALLLTVVFVFVGLIVLSADDDPYCA
jgi:hypothetical protein